MHSIRFRRPIVAACVSLVAVTSIAAAAEPMPDGWARTWSDEFDGQAIDPTKWDYDLGNGFFNYDSNQWINGWGNGEMQYYTKEPANAAVAEGNLHIRALKESYQGCGYTSARLKSRRRDGEPLFQQRYGRYELRAKLPTGQGIWPALWMLPQTERYGGWAASGEIDILEARGQNPTTVLGTLHYGSRWPANAQSGQEYELPNSGSIADFHVYALEWEPGAIRWYVDGQRFASQSFWWSSGKLDGDRGAPPADESELASWPAPFDQPFYLILNVEWGDSFPAARTSPRHFPRS